MREKQTTNLFSFIILAYSGWFTYRKFGQSNQCWLTMLPLWEQRLKRPGSYEVGVGHNNIALASIFTKEFLNNMNE